MKAVVFDFDGLILDTESAEYAAWSSVFADHGVKLELSDWSACVGAGPHAFSAENHLESLVGEPIDQQAALKSWQTRRDEILIDIQPRAGIVELLDDLDAERVPYAIASSSRSLWVDGFLQNLGWRNRFVGVHTRDTSGHPKPNPASYKAACQDLGIDPIDAVALEDSTNGLLAARDAGLIAIAIPNPVTESFDLSLAHKIVSSAEELSAQKMRVIHAAAKAVSQL
ncbi:MAG: HAD-IA family hydrolase [Armatimonadetes bacterium]|nr:HAD-IA family hydrolase [Armatimonadota bacterium]